MERSSSGPDDVYRLKAIQWCEQPLRIVTQNKNGPCPLISIANVLLLRSKISLPFETTEVSYQKLVTLVADHLMNLAESLGEEQRAIFQQNVTDVMNVFPKLQTGLDVNVKYSKSSDFEFTPELAVFDLLQIQLLHGWIPDKDQDSDVYETLQACGYNQAVELAISGGDNASAVQDFLNRTASQLTPSGIAALFNQMSDGEIAVLFRNNHFNTMLKRDGMLYVLLTDEGFLFETVVWQQLIDVADSGRFVDSNFEVRADRPLPATSPVEAANEAEDDFAFARRLQEEEDRKHAERLARASQPTPVTAAAHQAPQARPAVSSSAANGAAQRPTARSANAQSQPTPAPARSERPKSPSCSIF